MIRFTSVDYSDDGNSVARRLSSVGDPDDGDSAMRRFSSVGNPNDGDSGESGVSVKLGARQLANKPMSIAPIIISPTCFLTGQSIIYWGCILSLDVTQLTPTDVIS